MAIFKKGLTHYYLAVLLACFGFSAQVGAVQVHAREVSRIDFDLNSPGVFVEHGFALIEELSNATRTVYSEFQIAGNIATGQISSTNFVFNIWAVNGQSGFGIDPNTGTAYVDNDGNSPVSMGTTAFISGSVGQIPDPAALTANLTGSFTPSAIAAALFGLSAPMYTVTGNFLHLLFVDAFPILVDPNDINAGVSGFIINDVVARDVLTFTAVPVPGSIWLFGSAVLAWLRFRVKNAS